MLNFSASFSLKNRVVLLCRWERSWKIKANVPPLLVIIIKSVFCSSKIINSMSQPNPNPFIPFVKFRPPLSPTTADCLPCYLLSTSFLRGIRVVDILFSFCLPRRPIVASISLARIFLPVAAPWYWIVLASQILASRSYSPFPDKGDNTRFSRMLGLEQEKNSQLRMVKTRARYNSSRTHSLSEHVGFKCQ